MAQGKLNPQQALESAYEEMMRIWLASEQLKAFAVPPNDGVRA
jgi:hypothetical protein